jgi:hypothetical protein
MPGSYRHATLTPDLSWSGTTMAGVPPKNANAREWVRHALRERRLGVRVVRGAEDRDEELHLHALARARIDVVGLLAGVVDKQLLAGAMLHAHRQPALGEPLAIVLAELRVPVPVGVPLQVHLVQQLQRHAGLRALGVNLTEVGQRLRRRRPDRRAVEALLERLLGHRRHRRPVQAGRRRASERRPDRAGADVERVRRLPVRQAERQLHPQDFLGLPHGQSLRRRSASSEARADDPCVALLRAPRLMPRG